jgi:hypothetical protein
MVAHNLATDSLWYNLYLFWNAKLTNECNHFKRSGPAPTSTSTKWPPSQNNCPPSWLTGNHYWQFPSHDLPQLLELSQHQQFVRTEGSGFVALSHGPTSTTFQSFELYCGDA